MINSFSISTYFVLSSVYVHCSHPHNPPPYGPTPSPYGASPTPHYGALTGFRPHPTYGYSPRSSPYGPTAYPSHPQQHHHESQKAHGSNYGPPSCVKNATSHTYCLEDYEYPTYEIQHAVEYHYAAVASLYKDVLANTENSIDNLKSIEDEETFLCPSESGYLRPLRALNDRGHWRIIVNGVKAHYEMLSQTARVERCLYPGKPCPLVPECYHTKCLQKFIYHRFLVYDPYDYYFPFAIESFKMPSACSCFSGAFAEANHI